MLTRLALCAALTLAPLPAMAAEADPAPPDPLAGQQVLDPTTFAIRHSQLQLHQGFGLATLAAMAVTGGLGLYAQQPTAPAATVDAHLLAAGLTTGLYLTAATLELTAPRLPETGEPESVWDTSEIHEHLAWLHAAGMLSTVTLGLLTAFVSNSTYKEFHEWSAYGTFGLMALSAGVIAFGE